MKLCDLEFDMKAWQWNNGEPLLNYSERQVITVCTGIFFKHQSKTSDRDLGKRKEKVHLQVA